MPITIGNNIASLSAQRQLSGATGELFSVYERLSSGQRINRAKDDAAGLSIAGSLRAETRLFSQGIRNANDGLSALNIAESAIGELSNIVIRIKELAEQSSNGVYNYSQRVALDREAQALASEYRRITEVTKFNGLNLLDGTIENVDLQVGTTSSVNSRIAVDLAGVATRIAGDGTFQDPTNYAGTVFASDVVVGDFNGDGWQDFIKHSQTFLNDGTGGFLAPVANPFSGQNIVAGDVNGDGIADVVTSNGLGDVVSVYLGIGDGTFAGGVPFATVDLPGDLDLGDVNGDGNLDIVVGGTNTAPAVNVLLGNGDGTYQAFVSYNVGTYTGDTKLGDVNGDGILDLIGAGSGTTQVNLGIGDGTFGAAFNISSNLQAIAAGDINGDGFEDIVGTQFTNDTFVVALSNGNGTFLAPVTYNVFSISNFSDVKLRDLNGDGFLDGIVTSTDDTRIRVLLNQGDGTFAAAQSFELGNISVSVDLGDFNNDGAIDIVAGGEGSTTTAVILANTQTVSGLAEFDLLSQTSARDALVTMDDVLSDLASARGKLGAASSRVSVAIQNNLTAREASESARAQITDADVALEAAQLARLSILQQAAQAVLAQANQQPAIALSLLGG